MEYFSFLFDGEKKTSQFLDEENKLQNQRREDENHCTIEVF